MGLGGTIRQWMYPQEFRIDPPVWPPELIEAVAWVGESMQAGERQKTAGGSRGQAAAAAQLGLMTQVGTGLWRLRNKMVEAATGRPREEIRRAYRHLESVWDAMVEAGFDIQDHTGAPFDSGLSLKVIAFQPMAGMVREQVIETIKPTIYFNRERIQMGEVIVGCPEVDSEQATREAFRT